MPPRASLFSAGVPDVLPLVVPVSATPFQYSVATDPLVIVAPSTTGPTPLDVALAEYCTDSTPPFSTLRYASRLFCAVLN